MDVINQLDPKDLWSYFEDICQIPRISKNEEKIREYLLAFASQNNLVSKEDEAGNIVIVKNPSEGWENKKTVVLQSHMDMVGEKNASHKHNWLTDPIYPVIKGDWVKAEGTTLGADDGIGIAAQLAVLTGDKLRTGRIECLFTVDEETGMTGALNLKPGFFSGRTLINLDSEDEGILFIGCAGGIDTVGLMNYKPALVNPGSEAFIISLTGLHGGHSGDEIHKGYGNAVKLLNRLLIHLSSEVGFGLAKFDGGNLRNAIPREAFSTIVIKREDSPRTAEMINEYYKTIKDELADLESDLKLTFEKTSVPGHIIDRESQEKLLNAINICPHGVIAWSKVMDDLVETSTNLASVKPEGVNTIKIVTTQRSSVESSKHHAANIVEEALSHACNSITHSDGYPGWEPDLNSDILRITKSSYRKLFGRDPQVKAIHAGLECGIIYEKIPDIDMISIGPTIRGAHTPEEMIEIKTVQMFWNLLIDVIQNIPEEK